MKKILYTILQLTWGFPQTLAGFIIFLKNRDCLHKKFPWSNLYYMEVKSESITWLIHLCF